MTLRFLRVKLFYTYGIICKKMCKTFAVMRPLASHKHDMMIYVSIDRSLHTDSHKCQIGSRSLYNPSTQLHPVRLSAETPTQLEIV